MKLIGALGTAALSLALGVGIPAYAQQEQHEQREENKDKPAQEKGKEKKAQPEKPAKQEEKNVRQEQKSQEQHTQQAHGKGGRIPDERYKANFGREHRFHVSQADYSNRRFQFGGYWFGFEGAWPGNWLYTQDVYVIDIDGVYYLCNANYPGVNIILSVTL